MAEPNNEREQIVISTDDARGAQGPGRVTVGDTLLPMLIGGLVLVVVALIVVMTVL